MRQFTTGYAAGNGSDASGDPARLEAWRAAYVAKGGRSPPSLKPLHLADARLERPPRLHKPARPGRLKAQAVTPGEASGPAPPAAAATAAADTLQVYFDHAPECLFQVRVMQDRSFVYEALNPVALARIGAAPEHVLGRTPVQVLGDEFGGLITEGLERVRATGQAYAYEPTVTYGGETLTYEAVYMPLPGPDGAVRGILGRARDITQRRQLEASLLQAQKMQALGQLAGGVAHDFNNVLLAMAGCLKLLGRQSNGAGAAALLAEAHRSVQRGTALTTRLLAFARQQPMASEPVDVNQSLAEMAALLDRTLGRGVRVLLRAAPDLRPARADRNQFELAILNLAINARDAMPEGGRLIITTRNLDAGQPPVAGMEAGAYVAIDVADTGEGMTAGVLARARESFFTTKAPGRGSGLGLSMVDGMLRQIGGGMELASSPGAGTCVTLYLPRD